MINTSLQQAKNPLTSFHLFSLMCDNKRNIVWFLTVVYMNKTFNNVAVESNKRHFLLSDIEAK